MKKFSYLLLLFIIVGITAMTQKPVIRKAAFAGTFYPANAKELKGLIEKFFSHAKSAAEDDEIVGLISPHAGYVYSGIVAAQGYKQLKGRSYDAVIVISPSHAEYFPFSSIMAEGYYETPLGKIEIDSDLAGRIAAGRKTVKISSKGHLQEHLSRQEHALEVQLPFLQYTLGAFRLVPIVMGEQSLSHCQELADAIVEACAGKNVLIVASSDLSHYHPYNEARKLDERVAGLIDDFDYTKLYRELEAQKIEACGGGPIVTMLMATKRLGGEKTRVLMLANSGDTAGNMSQVVGYLSAIVTKKRKDKVVKKPEGIYNQEERKELLHIARMAIESAVKGESMPEYQVKSKKLLEKRGAFVTINKFGQLRGCIGYTQPVLPLHETVVQVARAAALEDPRFTPVTPDELKHLELEISVLTLPERIFDIQRIHVGKHGLIIKKGAYQGLLLPQVATEYGWERTTFLEQTCRKANLPPDAWKDKDTEIYIFSAEVFGEEE